MEINSQILNYLLPENSAELLKFLKSIEETPFKNLLTFQVNDTIEIAIEFDKRMLLDVEIELPHWATITHKSDSKELNLRVVERENIILDERKSVKEFREKNIAIFSTHVIGGNIDNRIYSFIYDSAGSYVLWENKQIIEIQDYIFRYLKLVAA